MRFSKRSYLGWGIAAVAATAAVVDIEPKPRKQTFAPQELNASAGPVPIVRETPALPKGSINFESAEETRLRVVVVTKGLQQPWSMAFLPDGTMLVTERIGLLRIVRNGKLLDLATGVDVQPDTMDVNPSSRFLSMGCGRPGTPLPRKVGF